MTIRIHCSNHNEADAVWRAWGQLTDSPVVAAELHVDGHGLMAALFRRGDAEPSAPHATPPGHSC